MKVHGLRNSVVLLLLGVAACSGGAAENEKRPLNVLFLMTDQHHAAALGCAGNAVVKTPNLDRLATGGTRFANSFCVVPYCSPTRLAIVTGRYPSSLGLGRNIGRETDHEDPLRLKEPCETYLHRLAALGYHCHQLGKWHVGGEGFGPLREALRDFLDMLTNPRFVVPLLGLGPDRIRSFPPLP